MVGFLMCWEVCLRWEGEFDVVCFVLMVEYEEGLVF